MRGRALLGGSLLVIALAGCVTPNDVAMRVGAPPQEKVASTVDLRSLQSRRYQTQDELRLMAAAIETLQDLGYTITEASAEVGVLVGSKQRDAEEVGQVASQIALTVVLAALGTAHKPTWDSEQSIHVTLVATPVENAELTDVRVSFDRRVTNNYGQHWRSELLIEQELYSDFFEHFSKGLFLEEAAL